MLKYFVQCRYYKKQCKSEYGQVGRCVFHVWKFGQRKAQFCGGRRRSGLHLKKKFGFGRWVDRNMWTKFGSSAFYKDFTTCVCPEEVKLHCMTVLVNQLFRKCSNIICSTNYDIGKNKNISIYLKQLKLLLFSFKTYCACTFLYLS